MVEGGTPNTLLRRGLTRDSLTVGTELIVDGYQTKDHSLKRANGRDVTFTDGRKMFMGSSGTGAPRDGADPTEGGAAEEEAARRAIIPGMASRRAFPRAVRVPRGCRRGPVRRRVVRAGAGRVAADGVFARSSTSSSSSSPG